MRRAVDRAGEAVSESQMGPEDVLLLVDVQRDFCPGGSLPIPGGDRVVPVLNRWIDAARRRGARIIASRDWHPSRHVSFRERGGPWPEHCVQGTRGADFHPDLRLPPEVDVVSKGSAADKDNYSAFDGTGLADRLKRQGVRRLWVGGLAQEVCVRATVLDARSAGFEVRLIRDAVRPVDADKGREALEEMQRAGATIVSDENISEENPDDGEDG